MGCRCSERRCCERGCSGRLVPAVALDLADLSADATAARIVLASTATVYGDDGSQPLTEAAPLAGQSAYARTKRGAEEALESAAAETVALRIANLWGPGFDDSLVARLQGVTAEAPAAVRGPAVFVHVDDVVATALAAALRPLPERHAPVYAEVDGGLPTWSVVDPTLMRGVLGVRARSLDELLS